MRLKNEEINYLNKKFRSKGIIISTMIEDIKKLSTYFKSRCKKVGVYAGVFTRDGILLGSGGNISVPSCLELGCLKKEKYGNNSSIHRLPTDCRSVHAEVVAIMNIINSKNIAPNSCYMVVSRYPCENCARMIAASRFIDKVIYISNDGYISDDTKYIFEYNDIIYEGILL